MISADKPVEAIKIREELIDSDFHKIIRSRRPSPSYDWEEGYLVIKGFRIKKVFVPAIEKPEETAALAMLLYREGWPILAVSKGDNYRIKPNFPEDVVKEERTGYRSERLNLQGIPCIERPYGPEDFIHTEAKFDSVCTGCGSTINVGDKILWSPRYKHSGNPKGETFHVCCEPGPVKGRKIRWEACAQKFAADLAEKMQRDEWHETWEGEEADDEEAMK